MNATERTLLTAIRDALDVPLPAAGGDDREFEMLQRQRSVMVRGAINGILNGGHSPETMAKVIRDLTLESPVTYQPYEAADAREVSR